VQNRADVNNERLVRSIIVSEMSMSTYIPSLRGIGAAVISALAGFVLPGMGMPHGGAVPLHFWVVGALVLFSSAAACLVATFSKTRADKVLGFLSGLVTMWLIYAFFR
jgi:hypothetical protein